MTISCSHGRSRNAHPTSHHHNSLSRSLFQNPWIISSTNPKFTHNRPVKLVKPDWRHSNVIVSPFEPNLRATWLGHAVRRSRPAAAQPVVAWCTVSTQRFPTPRVSSSSFLIPQQAKMRNHLSSCSTPSCQIALAFAMAEHPTSLPCDP